MKITHSKSSVTGSSEYTRSDRYFHSLIPMIADLLEDEGYDVSFNSTPTAFEITIYPSSEDVSDGTYTFPKSAIDKENIDLNKEAANIVDLLMGRAEFEDHYTIESKSITSGQNYNHISDFNKFWSDMTDEYTSYPLSDHEDSETDLDDDDDSEWKYIKSKSVLDSDGFYTDYTLYQNVLTGEFICMYGDNDVYEPDPDYADWSGDSEQEAMEWFDNYETGYEE